MNREQFLAERRKSIGGSDIGAILGLSKFKTPVGVWMDKTGRSKHVEESTLPQRYGQYMEDFIASEYTDKTARQTVRYKTPIVHPTFHYFTGNVDRLVIPVNAKIAAHQGQIRTDRGLEAKAVSAYAGGGWGDDESDDVPPFYLAQCQWYIGLNDAFRYWDLAPLIGNARFEVYEFRRDQDLIEMLQAKAFEFWNNNVLKDVAPPAQNEDDVLALFPNSVEGKRAIADGEVIASLAEAKAAKDAVKAAENRFEAAKTIVKSFMADAQELVPVGETKPIATWKNNKDSIITEYEGAYNDLLRKCEIANVLPKPELDGLHQELIAKHRKIKVGSRVFLIK